MTFWPDVKDDAPTLGFDDDETQQLVNIAKLDPQAVIVNSYYHNLGSIEEMTRDTLANAIRWQYNTAAGFLNGFTANEQAALLSTTLTVGKANVDGGGTESDTCKIFNLSATEVGLSGDFTEGSVLSLFNTSSNRIAKPTANAVANSGYTDSSLNASSAW